MKTITKPTLLIDKQKCLRNIERMLKKARDSSASLRPHFKTHHSAQIAEWFRESGIYQCTVSSVSMAQYFALHGWKDITIAFPYNPLESIEVNELAKTIKLNILIESSESFAIAKEMISHPVGYFLKIDVGTHRTGIDHRNDSLIQDLVGGANETLEYKGLLAHAGHTYGTSDRKNLDWIFDRSLKILSDLKTKFGGIVSFGDTPSCSIIEDLSFFDELRPGNFVFYDWMQHQIGSCKLEEIAVCMACPIVAIHSDRNEVVLYAGGVHLSKDFVADGKSRSFGKVVDLTEEGWSNKIIGNVDRLSQEHGIIKMTSDQLARVKVGDLIGVIPVHSCLTADLQGHYLSTTGERINKIIKD